MSCDQYVDAIAELADGTLPEAARRAVEAHLEGCPSCRALAADLGRIRQASRSLEPRDAPAVVWSRIERALAAAPGRPATPWFQQTRWLALAASLVVVAGAAALDPAVTTALRQNVALVDRAIADSRAALDSNPGSEPARESLFDALRRKVTLLQDTIALVGEMSRGNQAGAAEIVEGLRKS